MATSRTENCLTLDLSGIRALDAAGIGLLVGLQCWAEQEKKALRIAQPSACVRRLIDLTNLQSLLQVGDCGKLGSFEEWERAVLASGAERAMSA